MSDAEHARLLSSVAQLAVERLRGVSMKGVTGGPDWLGFETALWEISEDLRAYLKAHKRIRGKHTLLDAVAAIVADASYRKGRENFVLVLGEYGGWAYADSIAQLLDDADVSAQVLAALRKLKDGRFLRQARELEAQPPTPATKREARKYLKALEPA
jgi:hypothetical protein